MFYKKIIPVSMPQHEAYLAASAVVGNPISSVFGADHLKFIHDMLVFMKEFEDQCAALGLNFIRPYVTGTDIAETFFLTNYSEFVATPLQKTWSSASNSINEKVPLFARAYELVTTEPGDVPLYMKYVVGIKGVHGTTTTGFFSRVFVEVQYSPHSTFASIVHSRELNVGPSNYTANIRQAAVSGAFAMFINDKNAYLNLHCPQLNSPNNTLNSTNVAGRVINYTAPFNIPRGILISKTKQTAPNLPTVEKVVSIVPPVVDQTNSSSSVVTAFGYQVGNLRDASYIISSDMIEPRGVISMGWEATVRTTPEQVRSFAADLCYVSRAGTVYSFEDVIIIQTPNLAVVDFTPASIMLNGEPCIAHTIPYMNTYINNSSTYYFTANTFELAVVEK